MSRSNTRIQNLTRVTTLEALDIIPIGPASGDVAKGITKSDMEAQFEGDGAATVVQRFSATGTIIATTELAISTGTHTLIMPDASNRILDIKSVSGTITLDSGSNTVENSSTITTTVSRRFYLDGTVWLEL